MCFYYSRAVIGTSYYSVDRKTASFSVLKMESKQVDQFQAMHPTVKPSAAESSISRPSTGLARGIQITEYRDARSNPEPVRIDESVNLLEGYLAPQKLVRICADNLVRTTCTYLDRQRDFLLEHFSNNYFCNISSIDIEWKLQNWHKFSKLFSHIQLKISNFGKILTHTEVSRESSFSGLYIGFHCKTFSHSLKDKLLKFHKEMDCLF